jgi:hypothetical protein
MCMRPQATGVWGLKLPEYEALSYAGEEVAAYSVPELYDDVGSEGLSRRQLQDLYDRYYEPRQNPHWRVPQVPLVA